MRHRDVPDVDDMGDSDACKVIAPRRSGRATKRTAQVEAAIDHLSPGKRARGVVASISAAPSLRLRRFEAVAYSLPSQMLSSLDVGAANELARWTSECAVVSPLHVARGWALTGDVQDTVDVLCLRNVPNLGNGYCPLYSFCTTDVL